MSNQSRSFEQQPWLTAIDGETMRGLEIGALDKPRFPKHTYRVQYVDHASQPDLREKYAADDAMRDHLDDIVEVDFIWNGERPLSDVVGARPRQPIRLCLRVACHRTCTRHDRMDARNRPRAQ